MCGVFATNITKKWSAKNTVLTNTWSRHKGVKPPRLNQLFLTFSKTLFEYEQTRDSENHSIKPQENEKEKKSNLGRTNNKEPQMSGNFDDQIPPEEEFGLPIRSLAAEGLETGRGNHLIVPIRHFL